MKNILIFNGSPRKIGNSSSMINNFVKGAKENNGQVEILYPAEMNLHYCCGCLRCNVLGKCGRPGDDWEKTVEKMEKADVLVFSSPIYFHHISAQLKKLMDRFRSFMHVQITDTGLVHTPHRNWSKDVVVLLAMGSPDEKDAHPAVELFSFLKPFLSPNNDIHFVMGKRLAINGQIEMPESDLRQLYIKMKLDEDLAAVDFLQNQAVIERCYELGKKLSSH